MLMLIRMSWILIGRDHYEAPVDVVIKDAHNTRDNNDEDNEDDEYFDIPIVGGDEPDSDYSWVEECETDDKEFVNAQKNKSVFKSTIVDNGEGLRVDPQYGNDDEHLREYMDSDDEGFDTPCNSQESDLLGAKKKNKMSLVYNPHCDHTIIKFQIGMLFENAKEFKKCVQ